MHPASIASLHVASLSFPVIKITGHFDPEAASRRCSSIPEIPPRWMSSSRQAAVCALPLSSNASAEANVRLSIPLCANSRATLFRKPALSSTTITTVCCAAMSVFSPGCGLCPGWWPTFDLDQRNLVRCEQSACVEQCLSLRAKRKTCTRTEFLSLWPEGDFEPFYRLSIEPFQSS